MNSEFYVNHNKIMDAAFRACFNICDGRYRYVVISGHVRWSNDSTSYGVCDEADFLVTFRSTARRADGLARASGVRGEG
jgi:hypothetical protein